MGATTTIGTTTKVNLQSLNESKVNAMMAFNLQSGMLIETSEGHGSVEDVVRLYRNGEPVIVLWFRWHSAGNNHVEVLAYDEEVNAGW
jgi:hypothetical protein